MTHSIYVRIGDGEYRNVKDIPPEEAKPIKQKLYQNLVRGLGYEPVKKDTNGTA